jgi:hypothetical protein
MNLTPLSKRNTSEASRNSPVKFLDVSGPSHVTDYARLLAGENRLNMKVWQEVNIHNDKKI